MTSIDVEIKNVSSLSAAFTGLIGDSSASATVYGDVDIVINTTLGVLSFELIPVTSLQLLSSGMILSLISPLCVLT